MLPVGFHKEIMRHSIWPITGLLWALAFGACYERWRSHACGWSEKCLGNDARFAPLTFRALPKLQGPSSSRVWIFALYESINIYFHQIFSSHFNPIRKLKKKSSRSGLMYDSYSMIQCTTQEWAWGGFPGFCEPFRKSGFRAWLEVEIFEFRVHWPRQRPVILVPFL